MRLVREAAGKLGTLGHMTLELLGTQEERCKQSETDCDSRWVGWPFRDDIDPLTTQLRLVLIGGVQDLCRRDSKVSTDVSQLRQIENGLARLQTRIGGLRQSNGFGQCTLLEAKLLPPLDQQPTDQCGVGDDRSRRGG